LADVLIMEQKEKDQFSAEWRMKYLEALLNKQTCLSQVIGTNADNHNIKRNYEIACYKIELLELEHKIFWEEIVVNDWKERTLRYENKISQEYEFAQSNIFNLLKDARRFVDLNANVLRKESHEKILHILNKYDSIDTSDREQFITYYESLKLELERAK